MMVKLLFMVVIGILPFLKMALNLKNGWNFLFQSRAFDLFIATVKREIVVI